MFVWYIVAAVALVLFGGVFSGLTLGLMGLDTVSPNAVIELTPDQPPGAEPGRHTGRAGAGAACPPSPQDRAASCPRRPPSLYVYIAVEARAGEGRGKGGGRKGRREEERRHFGYRAEY